MKRACYLCIAVVAAIWFLGVSRVAARTTGEPGRTPGDRVEPSTDADGPQHRRLNARRDVDERRHRRLVDRLKRLESTLIKELNLPEDRSRAVTEQIANFVQVTMNPGQRSEADEHLEKQLQELHRRIFEARKRGDSEAAQALRAEWVTRRYDVIARHGKKVSDLLDRIQSLLAESDHERFRELVDRVGLNERRVHPPGPLATLMRSLRHQSLKLTKEQEVAIRRIAREEMKSIQRGEVDQKRIEEKADTIHRRVTEELSAEQRAILADLLKEAASTGNEPGRRAAARKDEKGGKGGETVSTHESGEKGP